MILTYVVLAAGSSSRMGRAKAVEPLAGSAPLARLRHTLAGRSVVVVTTAGLRNACAAHVPDARIAVNRDPERGMSSSLQVADAAIDAAATLGVLLADKPLISRATILRCEAVLAGSEADVLYTVSPEGAPGHPVFFRPAARARLATLPPGDTLAQLRDDPSLSREEIAVDDEGAFCDLDTPEDWERAERRLRE